MIPLHDDNPTVHTPYVTLGIVVLNFVAFVWLIALPPEKQELVIVTRGFIPKRMAQLADPRVPVLVDLEPRRELLVFGRRIAIDQPRVQLPPNPTQIYASAVTAMFLHGGWLHLIGNMWFLWLFGNNIEDRLGHLPYAVFYLFGGLLATAVHWSIDPASTVPVIGASGAVAAILGAYLVKYPFAQIKTLVPFVFLIIVELPAIVVLGLWFATQILEGLGGLRLGINGGVAWWAHVGGFIAGMVLMPLLCAIIPPDPDQAERSPREMFV